MTYVRATQNPPPTPQAKNIEEESTDAALDAEVVEES